jgi:hypothetical protein
LGQNYLVSDRFGDGFPRRHTRRVTYREMVLSYFDEEVPEGEWRAVRHIEEDLKLKPKTLSGVLNRLTKGDNSPLVTKLGPYIGEGEPRGCPGSRRSWKVAVPHLSPA